jgi:hypothetical protein
MGIQSGKKRQRILTDGGYSDGSYDSEPDITLREEIENLRKKNKSRDGRLRRLEATMEQNFQDVSY